MFRSRLSELILLALFFVLCPIVGCDSRTPGGGALVAEEQEAEEEVRCIGEGDPCILSTDCCDGLICVDGACVECRANADCPDDGLFCTGDPACVDNECGFSGNPCPANEICDEDADRCVECTTDAQCDDNEQCVDGECVPEPCTTDLDCEDGQVCDTGTGQCVSAKVGGTRGLPTCYEPDTSFTVRIVVKPTADTLVVGLQDFPPSGWTVSNISHDGEWDATNGAVKWFFLDDQTQTLTYDVTPPGDAAGNACFAGQVNADGGTDQDVVGGACIETCPSG